MTPVSEIGVIAHTSALTLTLRKATKTLASSNASPRTTYNPTMIPSAKHAHSLTHSPIKVISSNCDCIANWSTSVAPVFSMRFRILKTELKSEANSTSIAPDNVFTTAAPLLLLRNPSTTFCPNCTKGLTLLTSSKATDDSTAAMAPSNHNIVLGSLTANSRNQFFVTVKQGSWGNPILLSSACVHDYCLPSWAWCHFGDWKLNRRIRAPLLFFQVPHSMLLCAIPSSWVLRLKPTNLSWELLLGDTSSGTQDFFCDFGHLWVENCRLSLESCSEVNFRLGVL